jgi:hypothetical protein
VSTRSLPNLQLAPNQTASLDLGAALKQAGVTGSLSQGGLTLAYTGNPGDLVAHLTSSAQTGNYVFDVPFKDPAVMMDHIGGSYPWHIDGDYESIIHVRNTTDQPARFTIQLDFQGGSYALSIKMMAPQQEIDVNVRALRDGQVKDSVSRVIPLSVTSGHASWHERGPQPLIGRAEVYSVSAGIASSFSCGDCCFYTCSVACSPTSMQGMPGESSPVSMLEMECSACYTFEEGPFDVSASSTWSSNNKAVAKMTVATPAQCNMLASGFALITVSFLGTTDIPAATCADTQEFTSNCPVTVSPQITGINPNQGVVGLTYGLTITGTGFTSAAVVNVDQPGSGTSGITVENTFFEPPSQIAVNFVIAQNASPGNHNVTVTVGGQTSKAMNFFVQVPTRVTINNPGNPGAVVVIDPGPGNIINGSGVQLNQKGPVCGAYENVTYQLADQRGNPILAAGSVNEVVTQVSGTDSSLGTSSGGINDAGQMADTLAIFKSSSCPAVGDSVTDNHMFSVTLTGQLMTYNLTTVQKLVMTKTSGGSPPAYSFTITTTTP